MRRAILIGGALALVWVTVAGRVLVVSKPVAHPDAILSLASHEWERLPAAAAAAARDPDAHVWLTQPILVNAFTCHDCGNRVRRLGLAGVAPARVSLLTLTREGTRGEAEASVRQAAAQGVKRLLVVTSPYHTRRTLAVFRHEFAGTGVEIGVEPASRFSAARPGLWFMAPFDRWYVAYEWAAIGYYAVWHHIWPVLDRSADLAAP